MSDENQKKDVHLGMFDRPQGRRVYAGDWAAGVLSVVWIIICVLVYYFAGQPNAGFTFSALNFVVTVLAVLLPIALIWVAAVAARSVTVVREESIRMQAAMDTLRKNFVDLSQSSRMQVKPAEPAAQVQIQPVAPPQSEQAPTQDDQSVHRDIRECEMPVRLLRAVAVIVHAIPRHVDHPPAACRAAFQQRRRIAQCRADGGGKIIMAAFFFGVRSSWSTHRYR